jgi:hypothetical protein
MPDEYSVLAYYNGNAEEAYKTTEIIIKSPIFNTLPPQEKDRITKNMEFYSQGLISDDKKIEESAGV